jgi:hypothetical protein
MKKTTATATFFLMLSAGAAGAGATNLNGSDTMKVLTLNMLNGISGGVLSACPGTSTLTYVGGGSGTGETNLSAGSQQVAPMSRALKTGSTGPTCTGAGTSPANSEQLAVALDGISIVAADVQGAGCGGAAVNTTIAAPSGNYTFTDWKDALKVLFAGVYHAGSAGASCGAAGTTACCSHDIRATLANSYGNLFQTKGSCTSQTCTQIRHAYRRDDLSGTTDTFLSVLGLPAIGTAPFCNGTDLDDKDPIRRACDPSEQTCNADGKLGLVLPVTQPETSPTTVQYNNNPCNDGVFKWFFPSFNAPTNAQGNSLCPNGKAVVFGKCLTPVDTANHPGCLMASDSTTPVGSGLTDPRVYNLTLFETNGTITTDTSGREMTGAYYRIHQSSTFTGSPGTATPCTQPSSTMQIGCLTLASQCSVGFAGREAGELIPNVSPLAVNGVAPSTTSIRALITDPTNTLPTTYRLARFLWLNTMKGFSHVTGPELSLAQCFNTQSRVDAAASAAGFITLGQAPICVDFNEQTGCGLASNTDACAANPLGTQP